MALEKLSGTDITNLKKAKPTGKTYREGDGGGLYLHVSATGGKSWVFITKANGKRKEIGLGSLDTTSLKEAREKAREYRKQIANGQEVEGKRKRRAREQADAAKALTFRDFAEQCIDQWQANWRNPKHKAQWRSTLTTYVYPTFGDKPVAAIDTTHVRDALSPIWQEKPETAGRVRGRIDSVLTAAKAAGLREGDNPAQLELVAAMLGPLKKTVKHQPALPYGKIPGFFASLKQQKGTGALALQFQIMTAARPGEVRGATWAEIDLDNAIWTVPAGRMKGEREHRVPLCAEALAVLKEVEPLKTGLDSLIFPGSASRGANRKADGGARALSDATLAAVVRRMHDSEVENGRKGWTDDAGDVATAHGFRSTCRDWAGDKTDFPREVIEAALSHKVGTKVEQAYRRGTAFDKRRELMKAWGDYVAG